MKRTKLTATAFCALATVSGTALLPSDAVIAAPAATDNGVILMSVGASRVVNLPGRMSDVIIADPNVADVVVRSQTQIYILAKAAGEDGPAREAIAHLRRYISLLFAHPTTESPDG